MTNRPEPKNSPDLLFKPFTQQLWLAIVALGFFTGIIMWLYEADIGHPGNDIIGSDGRTLYGLMRNFARTSYLSFSTLFGTGSHEPKTIYGQVYCTVWIFFSLIIISSYTANLASILTMRDLDTEIKTIEDVIAKNGVLCNKNNTAFGQYVKNAYGPLGLRMV